MRAYKYTSLTDEMKRTKTTQRDLSKVLGIHENSVRKKLDGKFEWTISEINTLCNYFKKDYYELFRKD